MVLMSEEIAELFKERIRQTVGSWHDRDSGDGILQSFSAHSVHTLARTNSSLCVELNRPR
jgi:hypothetical protein